MSDNAEFSVWSNDETELLEFIDHETKLVSSSSESESQQVHHSNSEVWKVLQSNKAVHKNEQNRQPDVENVHSAELNQNSKFAAEKLKTHFSSNDLSKLSRETPLKCESVPKDVTPFSHSHSCNSLSTNERNLSSQKKYDHVHSKITQYFRVKSSSEEGKVMNKGEEYVEANTNYLEEVNKRLMMELEEKNALLSKLQENYENLLLKYAEAQNKIDQLRLKSVCESSECQTHSILKQNLSRTNLQLPINIFSNAREHQDTWEDGKCQKAVVAPFMKDSYPDKPESRKLDRPTSLPLESKVTERDAIKAGTPTDSEGVSSVITSMSGHSKILNTLDVQSPSGESKFVSYPERDFILNDSSVVSDAFDKVKNWQNSLPPLELIETPDTTLYDETHVHESPSTNYHIPPSSKDIDDEEDGVVFPSPRKPEPYEEIKEYRRSTPRKKNQLPMKHPKRMHASEKNEPGSNPQEDIPSGCIIQRRRKKPPLLRCSSLPAYDYDSPRSATRNMYVPPLDLENLTLSDVDSSQVDYDYSKQNRGTSSSYITSQSGSMEFSSQTYRTLNQSFKGRISQYTDSPYSIPCFNKSTSISPERCNNDLIAKSFPRTKPDGTCHVCGEKIQSMENFPCRSNSYQSFNDVKDATTPKTSSRKHPFNRSVSFNSETNSHRRCFHSHLIQHQKSNDSLETFDAYANSLKARSQVIMKALAAHVNNS